MIYQIQSQHPKRMYKSPSARYRPLSLSFTFQLPDPYSRSLHYPTLKSPFLLPSSTSSHLSSEAAGHAAGGGGTSCGCGGGGTGLDHLDGDAATEGAGVAGVDELDEAGVGLAGDVASAAGASGHVDLEGVVLVDVGGTLHDAHCLQGAGPGALLRLLDLALGAGNLGLDVHGGPALAGTVGVEHGLVGTRTVGGDDVQGAGDGATGGDLSQGVAGEGHGGLGAGLDVVVSLLRGVLVNCGCV